MGVLDGERYLRAAVESVLTQSFPDFEFVIVDDASADTTRQILDSFADDRIQIVTNQHNLGLTRSLNVGLAAARGAYVARMDADDVTLPGRFEQQVAFLDANPERAMVASFVEHIDADGASLGVVRSPVEQGEIVRSLRQGNCFAHGTVMFRRDRAEALGGYDEEMEHSQDYDLWLQMLDEHRLACLPEVLYRWREHPLSISSRRGREQERFARLARRKSRVRRAKRVVARVECGELGVREAARGIGDFACEQASRPMAEAPREAVSSRVRSRLRKSSAWQRWILRPRVEAQASRALEALSTAGRNVVATRDFLTGLLEDPFDS